MWNERLDNETLRLLFKYEQSYRTATKNVRANEYLPAFTKRDFEELAEYIDVS